uniref:Uncharacterized protein n=1 Tax=viral metagenome TaxID=1070528 RepID=A0A6C0EDN7_9ZZZZ
MFILLFLLLRYVYKLYFLIFIYLYYSYRKNNINKQLINIPNK